MEARGAERSGNGVVAGQAGGTFDQILVGIDDTPESLVAAAQAGVLCPPGGRIVLVGVVERHLASHAGLAAPHAENKLEEETEAELARAKELVDADEAVLAAGSLVKTLSSECARRGAKVVAIGVRPHRRRAALTFGGQDAGALNEITCSVLIGRPGWGPAKPDRILIALDGSPESRAAEAVARGLAGRLGVEVVPVIGLGDGIELAILREERDDALLDPGRLSDAVVAASTRASLIVVGRGRERGRRWGGSRAEKIVHSARCSVLVVQDEAGTAG